MIPQGLRPIVALITMVIGLLVIVNHWIGLIESDVDILTSHAVGVIGVFSGLNMMSSANKDGQENRPRYLEDTQTKFWGRDTLAFRDHLIHATRIDKEVSLIHGIWETSSQQSH